MGPRVLSRLSRAVFLRVEAWLSAAFGANNPFYHLGSLGFYFFYIMVVSGLYLIIYYEPTVSGSYDQLEYLTREQWYLGGVMRSLHRYAADGMVLVMALHILRELVLGRFRGARWFSWVTGIPVLILVYIVGIEGFWMVWDELAQFLVVRTAEWLDWLAVLTSPTARNFLSNDGVTDIFFRMLIIVHVSLPLFLQAFLLLHVRKVSRARIHPPRALALGTLASLVLLSLIQPTVSGERADLGFAAGTLPLDWFYMFFYPLMDLWSMGAVWVLVAGVTLLLALLPWLPPKRTDPIAEVSLENCNGCGFCADDCPFEAIVMQPRSDNRPALREAAVIADNCVGCGICAGACPSSMPFRSVKVLESGIDLPQRNVQQLRETIRKALSGVTGSPKILILGCDHGVDVNTLSLPDTAALSLPCIGALPPAFVRYALRYGADGVLLTGCREGDCYHRLGDEWMLARLHGGRRPIVPRAVDRSRIGLCWAAPTDRQRLIRAHERLRKSLSEAPRK